MPSRVRIVVRTRPTDFATDAFRIVSNNTLCIARTADGATASRGQIPSKSLTRGGTDAAEGTVVFNVDAVLDNASQEVVYDATTTDLVDSALQGFNCTLLCYGQCGSGKTYTLFGGSAFATRGCVPRAIEALFYSIKTTPQREFSVSLTFVEVYGEQVFDLLGGRAAMGETGRRGANNSFRSSGGRVNAGNTKQKSTVIIDANGAVALRGVKERSCANEAEALAAVFEGMQQRMSSPNHLNAQSSSSHAVLTFYIVSKSLVDSDAMTHRSRCNFVDLAGSERPHAPNDEVAVQEAHMIRRSHIMLEQVILAMSGGHTRHVPYRQSKLTMLLKDSIGGTNRATLIANIWPEQRHMEATLATLNFAKRLARVESSPSVHASMDPQAQIKMLQKQVASLKSELRMQDQMAGREAVATAPLESDEIQAARDRVTAFINGTTPQVNVSCVREMHACFFVFKHMLEQRSQELREMERQIPATPRPGSSSSTAKGAAKQRGGTKQLPIIEPREQAAYVSTIADKTTGVGVGRADKTNSALPDMFQQQLRRGSNLVGTLMHSGLAAGSAAKGEAYAAYAPKHDAAAAAATTTTVASSSAVTMTTASKPQPAVLPKSQSEEEFMRTLPFSNAPTTRNGEESPTGAFVHTDHSSLKPTVSGFRPVGRREGMMRDKRVAFEAYKRSNAGASQLETINKTQKLLAEKNEAILQLHQRLGELKAEDDAGKRDNQQKTALERGPMSIRCASVDMPQAISEISSSVNDPTVPRGDTPSSVSADALHKMSPPDKKAVLHHTTSTLARTTMEQGALVKQLDRLREAFLNNFHYWYQTNMQSVLQQQQQQQRSQVERAFVGAAEYVDTLGPLKDAIAYSCDTRRVQIQHADGDVCRVDRGEQCETAKMQEGPESAAFYAAQKLAWGKLLSR